MSGSESDQLMSFLTMITVMTSKRHPMIAAAAIKAGGFTLR